MTTDAALPDDIATLKAMLLAERATHRAEIEKLKHTIARLRHEQYGQSAERRELLDQLGLQLGELEENQAQAATAAEIQAASCCGGVLHKLGEVVTETLELVPRQWKLVCHVREKYSCRPCEKITQPPAPSHPIAPGRAGPGLLAHVLFSK